MYTCGPTVYRYAHIGNLRTFLRPTGRRALEAGGTEVRQVQNITDVGHMTNEEFDRGEDRMLVQARLEDRSPAEIAAYYTEAYLADAAAFNLQPAADYPRASDYVPQMLELVQKLERGNAYEVDGNVYFAVESFPGTAACRATPSTAAGHRQRPDPRKRPRRLRPVGGRAGPDRPVALALGRRLPRAGIECSAMSLATLGEHIDLHRRRGQRLPHHEDEIAQSEAVVGHQVVTTWVHGRHLLTDERKMAKSAGNFTSATGLAEQGHRPLAARLLFLQALPDTPLNFTWDAWPGPSGPWTGCARGWPAGRRAGPARPPGAPGTRSASGARSTTTWTPRPPWPSCTSWRATSRCPRGPATSVAAFDRFLGLDLAAEVGQVLPGEPPS